ncbi:MAG: DUF2079 domain-containing protein [Patescibacteria group bacterium]
MKLNLSEFNKQHNKKPLFILTVLIFFYIVLFVFISVWKYNNFGYNAIDLAIFNQVFYNTSMGDLFSMTIHPHSYLGDHFEIIILLLTPIYMLFRNPVSLLVMQTIIIGISAWPLFLIAKKISNNTIALCMAAIYLLNPFIQNMNLFEFHILPFAIFTLLFAFYFYLENRFYLFTLFLFLSLLVREDVALVVVMFSLLSLIDKKNKRWIITPGIIGIGWLAIVFWIVPTLNNYDSYKFIFYYSWLGDSVSEIIKNFFLHPLLVLSHLFSLQNIFLYIALFLPFLLLPFLKPKYLLLSLLAFLQLLLGSFSGELILKTHYSALLLVSVFITTIYALNYLFTKEIEEKDNWQARIKKYISGEPMLFIAVFVAVTIYGTTTFGPIIPAIRAINSNNQHPVFNQLKKQYINLVPNNSSVTTSYDFLPHFSSRSKLYSLHYAFLGKKQYSNDIYTLPKTDYMVIDTKDFLTYQVQYPDNSFYQNAYSNGDNNIRSIIEKQNLKVSSVSDDLLLFSSDSKSDITLYRTYQEKPEINHKGIDQLAPGIQFAGWGYLLTGSNQSPEVNIESVVLPVSLYWRTDRNITENYQLSLQIKNDADKIIYKKYYALGYGILPSSEWKQNEYIQTNYWFYIPNDVYSAGSGKVSISLVKLSDQHSYLGVDGLLTATMKNIKYDSVGPEITIPMPE